MPRNTAPFGYRFTEQQHVVPDAMEQKVLDKMKEYRESGLSYNVIAGNLNSEGIRMRGRFWNGQTVRYLLTREPIEA